MRWLWSAFAAGAIALVGCGGGGGANGETGGGDDGGDDASFDSTSPILNNGGDSGRPATCTPRDCTQAGANCGPVGDGCGGQLDCGTCTAPATCGGGGTPSVCGGTAACVPKTCQDLAATCGPQGDGCGTVIDCGTCSDPHQTCGGGGVASQCGGTAGCVPLTACPAGQNCGVVANGCGGTVDCSGGVACPGATTCGGGGTPNQCGGVGVLPDGGVIDGGLNNCTPATKAQACAGGKNCGVESDGCGGTVDCSGGVPCPGSTTCGGGGTPSVCGGTAGCVPVKACPAGMNCGVISDGCGGTVDCSGGNACPGAATCGGGGVANQCGGVGVLPDGGIVDGGLNQCTPATKAQACAGGKNCGVESDGCGGTVDCSGGVACPGKTTCGGGGTPGVCGGAAGCVPTKACPGSMNCGVIADGCGGTVDCSGGKACVAGTTCGGGGVANQCGAKNFSDGGFIDGGLNTCTPIPQGTACAGIGCGSTGDGCGNTYVCGTCTNPQDTCGGAGVPFQCGHPACTPATTCPVGVTCGTYGNGCGGTISCGTCTVSGQTCGGGGTPYTCGTPPCTPATTCPTGVNCGPWADGCGGKIASCGSCNLPAICGGSGVPSQCGDGTDGGFVCQGLQCNQVQCDGGATTSISGVVLDPAGLNPVYNAYVFVPATATPLGDFKKGVSCDTCDDQQTSLISVKTGPDGKFLLKDVPVVAGGTPVVFQIGRWRREILVNVGACKDNPLTTAQTHLPTSHLKGTGDQKNDLRDDIPLMAISTGSADPFECLLVKMGIATSEFVNSTTDTTGGRIHYYHENGVDLDGTAGGPAPAGSTLWTSAANLKSNYDIVLLPCEGSPNDHGDTARGYIGDYADHGGRVFVTHYSYEWAAPGNTGLPWGGIASWDENQPFLADPGTDWCQDSKHSVKNPATITGNINTTFKKGSDFATWLQNVGASTTFGQLTEHESRHDVDTVPDGGVATAWITTNDVNTNLLDTWDDPFGGNNPRCDGNNTQKANSALSLQHMTFNTPTDAGLDDAGVPKFCGRVVYSDFHVSASAKTGTSTFPGSCATGALSAQEKALEFMLFDLSSCIQPDNLPPVPNPSCTPVTSCPASVKCGPYPNGCDTGVLQCGTCPTGQSCVGGACVGCNKLSCSDQGLTCGAAGDGCGGTIANGCGTCQAGQTCIGGACKTDTCVGKTCNDLGLHCGPANDGCGHPLDCGKCTIAGQTCGGGGTPGVCGQSDANLCSPLSCTSQGIHCGPAGDGCGNLVDCGPCPPGSTCGGGGTPGVCGAPSCTPLGCGNLKCGPTGDGCGNIINCGQCVSPQTCGGGGTPGQCGQSDANACNPLGCGAQKCGPAGDGCGNLIDCGQCTPPQTCGGGGVAGQCGAPSCTPLTCGSLKCGQTGDGCGGILDCGTCTPPQTCGGGGTPGVCGQSDANACLPLTCADQNLACGQTGDGCGHLIDCGSCPTGQTCGGGGIPGVCGAPSCTPKTCAQLGATCGQVADGCGGLTPSCGDCTGNATCGGGGTANQCGQPNCTPRTCTQAGANCGPVADGCGSVIQCGDCTPPQTCGGGGTPSICGGGIH